MELQHKVCGKRRYPSRKVAKSMMKKINKDKTLKRKLTNAYFCDDCQQYHLTSQNKTSSRNYTRKLNKDENT